MVFRNEEMGREVRLSRMDFTKEDIVAGVTDRCFDTTNGGERSSRRLSTTQSARIQFFQTVEADIKHRIP